MATDKAVDAYVDLMRPQVEAALRDAAEAMTKMLEHVSTAETDRCIQAAEACRMTTPSPIGPLHYAGWNDGVAFVVKSLRAWKVAATEPSSVERKETP